MYIIWIIATILFLVIELIAGNFVMICFSIGALFSVFAALLGLNITWQVIIFSIFSAASIFFLRPVAIKYLHRKKERKSNADAMIGRIGKVVEPISENGFGYVALDGDTWKAQSFNNQTIEKGSIVEIIDRKSTIIIVKQQ
jgi:membrane protein implicated in regulation of membrane protease activity